ncbi:MAG: RnfABCDGE type electron transport complex subunit G [Candidatus Omnitrophota bacterium]
MVICLIAALVLALSYEATEGRIERQRMDEVNRSLESIFPQADSYEKVIAGGTTYYKAEKNGKLKGHILKVTAEGYGGPIVMMVGLGLDKKITGIVVLEHLETPGLGAKIVEIKKGQKKPWFPEQFIGKRPQDLKLGGSVQAITGATISSKAVVDAVKKRAASFLAE